MLSDDIDNILKSFTSEDKNKIKDMAISMINQDIPNEYGKPKMFIITFMIHTRLSEQTMAQLTDKFVDSIPSKDWSKNMMVCDIESLEDKG